MDTVDRLTVLTKLIQDFAEIRDWDQFLTKGLSYWVVHRG